MRNLVCIVGITLAIALSANTASANIGTARVTVNCKDGRAVATFTYEAWNVGSSLTANQTLAIGSNIVKSSTFNFAGPGGVSKLATPFSGTRTLHAKTEVYGAGGRLKRTAEKTVTCSSPPPPRYAPRAWAQGPCEDPMYRFWLDNRRSNRPVTFNIIYQDFDHGPTTITRTVPRGVMVHTGYRHVTGSTAMTIRARGKVLFSEISAPGGMYRPCW